MLKALPDFGTPKFGRKKAVGLCHTHTQRSTNYVAVRVIIKDKAQINKRRLPRLNADINSSTQTVLSTRFSRESTVSCRNLSCVIDRR